MRIQMAVIALSFLAASSLQAAAPAVPTSFSYQGVLLDSAGQPQSGPVDLAIRLWDQGFAGTLLYKQEFNNTVLVDGVFSVKLGPSGVGIDVPTSPLTLNLVDAVTTDLGASGAVWIEVSVDGNTPLTRTQFRAVPFALKAESAVQADNSSNILTPAGVDSTILDAVWQNFNFDGGGPANTDSSEGPGDTDQDGILNFVDPDNDNDAISDIVEVGQGSDINLVTPRIDSFSGPGGTFADSAISVTGNSFDPSMTATLGAVSVTPTAVTLTNFDFLAPPMPAGTYPFVATHPNGETGSRVFTYSGAVFGVANDPIEAVAIGIDQVLVHADNNYFRDTVDDGQVLLDLPQRSISGVQNQTTSMHWDSTGRLAALNRNFGQRNVLLSIDANLDGDLDIFSESVVLDIVPSGSPFKGPSIVHDNADRIALAYIGGSLTQIHVEIAHDRDGNGDFLGPNESVRAEVFTGAGGSRALGELSVDSAARLAYVYQNPLQAEIRVAWDRSGDGDFNDTVGGNAEVFLAATSAPTCLGADFDAADALVVVYGDASGLHLRHDTSGDGDFTDAGEAVTLTPAAQAGPPAGCDVDASGTGLAIAVTDGSNLSLLVDRNGDSDFADTDEDELVSTSIAAPIATERLGSGKVVVITPQTLVEDPN